jgi:antitoxin ParD1/3/4
MGAIEMASMNISLPDPMKDWVETQTSSGRYDNASEYVRDLIRHDQDRADKIAARQKLVDEALDGNESDKSLAEIRRIARARAQSKSP